MLHRPTEPTRDYVKQASGLPQRADTFFQGVPYRRAEVITDRAIEFIDSSMSKPFFLFLNYYAAHGPYFPPREYRDLYPGRDVALGSKGISGGSLHNVLSGNRPLTAREYEHLTALYDGELTYLDSQLDRLFDHLRRHSRWDEMLVIVTADHGEAFGEHKALGDVEVVTTCGVESFAVWLALGEWHWGCCCF